MQFPLSFVLLAADAEQGGQSITPVVLGIVLFVLIILGFVILWGRVNLLLAYLEELRNRPAPSPNKQLQQLKQSSAAPDPSLIARLDGTLQGHFDRLMKEIGTDLAEVKQALRTLNLARPQASPAPAPPSSERTTTEAIEDRTRVTASEPTRVTLGSPSIQDLVRTYNCSIDEFKTRFHPKTAQVLLQAKQTTGVQLAPHDAGSFLIVEGSGRYYCVPRPGKITPTLHENVGLGLLFRYDGYDPKGPDMNFSLEKPASLTVDSGSGWSLQEPGQIRVKQEEA